MSKGHIYRNLLILLVFVFAASFVFVDLLRVNTTIAAVMGLPEPTQLLTFSEDTPTAVLRGLKVNPQNPLQFDFILEGQGSQDALRTDAADMINYFLAALTFSKESLWVNLSPYESDRIIEDSLAMTELGQDMLEQDYVLKQLVSSATYPETELGRNYWDKINAADAQDSASFNKVWIVSKEASVIEHQNIVVIENAVLEAKTEQDYLAMQHNGNIGSDASSSAVRDFIIPELNHELNNGSHFAKLRRMYSSIILAEWFKQKFVDSFYSAYMDKAKISGIDTADKESKEKIYNLYSEAFKKGVYNLIKTERSSNDKKIKRSYFSGGIRGDVNLKTKQSSGVVEFAQTIARVVKQADLYIANGFMSLVEGPRRKFDINKDYGQLLSELNDNETSKSKAQSIAVTNTEYLDAFSEIVADAFNVSEENREKVVNAAKYLTANAEDFAGGNQLTTEETLEIYKYIDHFSEAKHGVSVEKFFQHVFINSRLADFHIAYMDGKRIAALNSLLAPQSADELDLRFMAKDTAYYQTYSRDYRNTKNVEIMSNIRDYLANKIEKDIANYNEIAERLAEEETKKRTLEKYSANRQSFAVLSREFEALKLEISNEVDSEFAQAKQEYVEGLKSNLILFAETLGMRGADAESFMQFIVNRGDAREYLNNSVMGDMSYRIEEVEGFVDRMEDGLAKQSQPGIGLFSSSLYAFDGSVNLNEYLTEQGYDAYTVGDDRDIDELNPFEHRFEERDYARELVDFVIKNISFDAEILTDSELSVDVVEGYIQDLIRGDIDLDQVVYLLKDSITKIELVQAIRVSLNETLTLINYYDIFPVEFLEYRSMIPEYLAFCDFIQDSEVVRDSLSEDDLIDTMFNIERRIAKFIYSVDFDNLSIKDINSFNEQMRFLLNGNEEEIGILEALSKVGYKELQERVVEKMEALGMDISDHGLFSSAVEEYVQGGIDLKDIDIKSSSSSSAIMEFAPVDMSNFQGFTFTINKFSKTNINEITSLIGGALGAL